MSELTDKLHYSKSGTTDEITLYSTPEETENRCMNVKINGINAYAALGDIGSENASRMTYQDTSYVHHAVLKNIETSQPVITINLVALRNNEDTLQFLPSMYLNVGDTFYLNNANAPTISGYDFVCAVPNNFKVTLEMHSQYVNLYYIPQNIADNSMTDWTSFYDSLGIQGDHSKNDLCNTYSGTIFYNMFRNNRFLTGLPKINTSNAERFEGFCQMCASLVSIDMRYYDLTNVVDIHYAFNSCISLKTVNFTNVNTSKIRNWSGCFRRCENLEEITGAFDFSSATNVGQMFEGCSKLTGVHLKNVPSNLDLSNIGGIEGETYIIDNYID